MAADMAAPSEPKKAPKLPPAAVREDSHPCLICGHPASPDHPYCTHCQVTIRRDPGFEDSFH